MVLKNLTHKIIGIIVFFALLFFFSCEIIQTSLVNCNECNSEEPSMTLLEIKSDDQGKVIINIYEGNLEDNVLYNSFTTFSTVTQINVPVNKKYTLTSTYTIEGRTYVAVNSVTPHVKYIRNQCDEACYMVYDKVVDLRLKYTK